MRPVGRKIGREINNRKLPTFVNCLFQRFITAFFFVVNWSQMSTDIFGKAVLPTLPQTVIQITF